MTRREKLIERFLSKPKDFTLNELKTMLEGFGYREIKAGKTAGSRVGFFHQGIRHIIRLHKPHPSNSLKKYQLDLIEEELKNREVLE